MQQPTEADHLPAVWFLHCASTLLLQSRQPGSAWHAATSDINLQTKLHAVALPFIEP